MLTLDARRAGASCTVSSAFTGVDCLSALEDRRDGNGMNKWCFLGAIPASGASAGTDSGATDAEAGSEAAPAAES